MKIHHIRHCISREAIIGHETAWKVSDLGVVQFHHHYDQELLERIRLAALRLKASHAQQKHLNLTFIPGADRYIPEVKELIHNKDRLGALSELAGTELEPYPLSVVGTTITFMGPNSNDGQVDWHCDGVPVTELVPLSISDPILGGELEIFRGNCEVAKSKVDEGETVDGSNVLTIRHKKNYSTLAQFIQVLHRTSPILYGERITLVLNMRSKAKPFVDDNRMFYLAADNDKNRRWVKEMADDVWDRQLPSYQCFEAIREDKTMKNIKTMKTHNE